MNFIKAGVGIFAGLLLMLCAACGENGGSRQVGERGALVVSGAYTYAMPPGKETTAVYLSLDNTSNKTRILNYVHSPVAGYIEVHRSQYDNGMMKMRQVKHTTLDPKSKLVFKPSGYHLMLFDIDKPLQAGESFELNLEFEGGVFVMTQVDVRAHK